MDEPQEPQKAPEIKIEPIEPRIEPILPKIEAIERAPGTFSANSPERQILQTLEEGPRMRNNLIRMISAYMPREDAERLLERMLKSGVIFMNRSGRVSIVEMR